ncbi:MAG: mandelate racemase/muconate lactonizing enzyme family protein [Kiloniellales bacterium]
MKISAVRTTPLIVPFKRPIHSSYGARDTARVIMVEVEDDAGRIGIGESIAGPDMRTVASVLDEISGLVIGRDPRGVDAIVQSVMTRIVSTPGGDLDIFARRVVAGLDMALWDLNGKAAGVPACVLAGGPLHHDIGYFAFVNGDTPKELAEDAAQAVREGHRVIYMKLGRGDDVDIAATTVVRAAIGDARLRLDPNEAWDVMQAIDMAHRLAPYSPEFIEQPVTSHSLSALKAVKDAVTCAVAADQAIHSPADVFAYVAAGAADVIVLGPHEAGGLSQLFKAAAVADAGGVRLCLHATVETQITACANQQASLAIPNIDDGNQDMSKLLAESLIAAPSLKLTNGRLGQWNAPGLGFTLDADAVARAAARASRERTS